MKSDIPTNQDVIRATIIKNRENHIADLELKKENITEELKIQKDNLISFKKTLIPVISKQLESVVK